MKKISPFMQGFEQLPDTLAIFPLNNAVVMPGSHLPLNIFEPRYLNMIQDAMESHQLIGMIQPRENSSEAKLFKVGCAARITRYEETNDGRLEVSLTGLCRFSIDQELTSTRGYRLVVPNWKNFEIDYENHPIENENVISFLSLLKVYFQRNEYQLDWEAIGKLDPENLFNSLFCFIKLSDEDQQMLLEIDTTGERIKALSAILTISETSNQIKH